MSESARSRYTAAIPLWDAVCKHAPDSVYRPFVALTEQLFPDIPRDVDLRPEPGAPYPALSEPPNVSFDRWLALREDLRNFAFCMLLKEHWRAIGFKKPRYRNDEPEWIFPEHWEKGTYSWDISELWVDRMKYCEIRVASAPPNKSVETSASKENRRRKGPEKSKPIILYVYERLRDDGKIDFNESLLENFLVIQKAAAKHRDPASKNPSVRGLSYETIRRAIGNSFFRDQANWSTRAK